MPARGRLALRRNDFGDTSGLCVLGFSHGCRGLTRDTRGRLRGRLGRLGSVFHFLASLGVGDVLNIAPFEFTIGVATAGDGRHRRRDAWLAHSGTDVSELAKQCQALRGKPLLQRLDVLILRGLLLRSERWIRRRVRCRFRSHECGASVEETR